MANYECVIRTNYFHVKDAEKFKSFFSLVGGENLSLWEEKDKQGEVVFGFGCYGSINGVPVNENGYIDKNAEDEYDYDVFIDELKKHVADDDAIIIVEAGNEKLRYVGGGCHVITSKKDKYIDISNIALQTAKELLENNDYTTETTY